jgi:hypothetical protein
MAVMGFVTDLVGLIIMLVLECKLTGERGRRKRILVIEMHEIFVAIDDVVPMIAC